MDFFSGINAIEDLKAAYQRLAKEHHPDRGGDVEVMKQVNVAYEAAFRSIRKGEGISYEKVDEEFEVEQEIMEMIDRIVALPEIMVEICGRWIWVTGNTFDVKADLKEAGYHWASKKKCWYWHPEDAKCRSSRGEKDLDEIRHLHGSTKVDLSRRPGFRQRVH